MSHLLLLDPDIRGNVTLSCPLQPKSHQMETGYCRPRFSGLLRLVKIPLVWFKARTILPILMTSLFANVPQVPPHAACVRTRATHARLHTITALACFRGALIAQSSFPHVEPRKAVAARKSAQRNIRELVVPHVGEAPLSRFLQHPDPQRDTRRDPISKSIGTRTHPAPPGEYGGMIWV